MALANPPIKTQIQQVPAHAEPSVVQQILDNDGAVILQSVFSDKVIRRLNEELYPATRPVDGIQQRDYIFNLPAISNTFRTDVLNCTTYHNLAKSVLKDSGDYWITSAFAREIGPGSEAQQLHRDSTHPLLRYQTPDAPRLTIGFILALNDFKKDNGSTRVIIGSHKWPEIGKPTIDQAVPTEMKPGDVLVMAQDLVHGAGGHPHGIPGVRRAVLLFFSSCQVTPFETYMTMPRALVESMTPLAQKMIGWRSMKPGQQIDFAQFESKRIQEAMNEIHPNITGLYNSGRKVLEDALQLKTDLPLQN